MVELCLVTAIIAIAVSISTPLYRVYVERARDTEAQMNVETIAHLEQVRILELGAPIACAATPARIPDPRGHAMFDEDECWSDLGFNVTGRVRFQYETKRIGERDFVVFARGHIRGPGDLSVYRLDSRDMQLRRGAGGDG